MPVLSSLRVYIHDLLASIKLATDMRSRVRLVVDFTLSRFIEVLPKAMWNRRRQVCLRDDVKLVYRLNKGDLHSIREIWFEEDYWLPFESSSGVLLDLGANIGMASLWLSKKYKFTTVIAVEPDPTNAELVRDNLRLNSMNGQVLQAAIGPFEGTGRFKSSQVSNLGRLSDEGSLVQVLSVNAVIATFSILRFALIKIDIEGGEESLFDGQTEWLDRTDAMIMELHPDVVDCDRLRRIVSSHGFEYIPAHSRFPDNLPCFVRVAPPEPHQDG